MIPVFIICSGDDFAHFVSTEYPKCVFWRMKKALKRLSCLMTPMIVLDLMWMMCPALSH